MEHQINETELLSKKITKAKFRKSIIEEWGSCCYVCGNHFDKITLDHIVPKKAGGHTTRFNLATCCSMCNRRKGHQPVFEWWSQTEMWDLARVIRLISWLRRAHISHTSDDKTQ